MGSDSLLTALIGRRDDAIADAWRTEYELLMPEVLPFPSASALVAELHHSDIGVALATSAPADHVAQLIDLLGIAQIIDFATDSDDVDHAKPDPEIFLTAMHRGHATPDQTYVVGDSKWDVEAANAARIRCIAVESGGFSEAELRDAGAVAVYSDVHALRNGLRTSPLAELLQAAGS